MFYIVARPPGWLFIRQGEVLDNLGGGDGVILISWGEGGEGAPLGGAPPPPPKYMHRTL